MTGTQLSDPPADVLESFRTIIDTDPPGHARLRKLVNRGFTPRMLNAFEQHYRDVTTEILDAALPKGSFDFVTDVAAELPLVAIAELLGVPQQDRHKIREWTNRLVGGTDPEYDEGDDARIGAATELFILALSVGGNETTRNALTHGLLALIENPDQMRLLREGGPEVMTTAVEEIIRWATPVAEDRTSAWARTWPVWRSG